MSPGRPSKLNRDQVAEIARIWNARPTVKSIAVKYGVCRSVVYRITSGRRKAA